MNSLRVLVVLFKPDMYLAGLLLARPGSPEGLGIDRFHVLKGIKSKHFLTADT
jgi:hypothetical protein